MAAPGRRGPLRVAFAAAHTVADPYGDNVPGRRRSSTGDSTLTFRWQPWPYGYGVAEAVHIAQRGMGQPTELVGAGTRGDAPPDVPRLSGAPPDQLP